MMVNVYRFPVYEIKVTNSTASSCPFFVLFQWQGSWFGAFRGDVVGGIGMGGRFLSHGVSPIPPNTSGEGRFVKV